MRATQVIAVVMGIVCLVGAVCGFVKAGYMADGVPATSAQAASEPGTPGQMPASAGAAMPVPEPATLAFFGLGSATLLAMRKRRSHA
jgi:hypothetical protein